MRKRLTGERGLSLVEVTIMLLVLMLLTSVLAPSIFDFVNDAKWVKVKEDCEAIGLSVARLTRDVGTCLKFDGRQPCTMRNRVDMLYSDGPDVGYDNLGPHAVDFNSSAIYGGTLNWDMESHRGDSMEHQFVDNATGPAYPTPADLGTYATPGPYFNLGWRGAYLSPPIAPDPWGNAYLVNSVFLSVAIDAPYGTGQGRRSGGWSHDTFCISAGPNGIYETAFAGNRTGGVERQGDDFIYVISGDTR
ncbi:MAG: hypothetical protein AB1806_16280 [Acidobacteriota bacterium]